MKTIYLAFVILFLGNFLHAENKTVKVIGNVKDLEDNEVILYSADMREIARTASVGGHFTLEATVDIDDGQMYTLHFPAIAPMESGMKIPTTSLFLDAKEILLTGCVTERGFDDGKVTGSPLMTEWKAVFANLPVRQALSEAIDKYNTAFHEYNEVSMTDENYKELKRCGEVTDSLQEVERQQIFDLVSEEPQNKALALIVYYYSKYSDVGVQEKLLNTFDESIRTCYGLKKLRERIDFIRGSKVGSPAPDFELTAANGERVKLSSFRGQYVLVDFWASWCGPCRKAIPLVKQVYEDFKNKGLTVIGISIDQNEKDWRQALEEENMPYLQLHDPQGLTQRLYNFEGIPFIMLVSPDGIILERSLFGDDIRKAVEKRIK